jgi:hypothetical protein
VTVCEFRVVEVSLLLDEVELLPEVLLLLLVAVIVDSKSIAPSGVLHKNQSAGSRSLTPETENYLKTGSRLKGSCARCTIAQGSVKLSIIRESAQNDLSATRDRP